MNEIDVIVPARNEQQTIGAIIAAFHLVTNVGKVIVVDDKSTDDTWNVAVASDAFTVTGPGEGKGQAVCAGLQFVSTKMVCLCDADLVGFNVTHAAQLLDNENPGEIIGVPEFTPNLPWAHRVKHTEVWEDVSGERCLPTSLIINLPLHGYAMEVQINAAVERAGLPVKKISLTGVRGFVKPGSYFQRIQDWKRDLEWLRLNPI